MSTIALTVVTIMYGLTALDLARRGDWALATMFFAYSVANIALIFVVYK